MCIRDRRLTAPAVHSSIRALTDLDRGGSYLMRYTPQLCLALSLLLFSACSPAAEETKPAADAPAAAPEAAANPHAGTWTLNVAKSSYCLLYTSDAADERSSVDLGGRRIIK